MLREVAHIGPHSPVQAVFSPGRRGGVPAAGWATPGQPSGDGLRSPGIPPHSEPRPGRRVEHDPSGPASRRADQPAGRGQPAPSGARPRDRRHSLARPEAGVAPHLARDGLRPGFAERRRLRLLGDAGAVPGDLSMLISLYGLMFNPATVEPQLQKMLRHLLPPAAFALIAGRVHTWSRMAATKLGLSLLISTALTLWSASTGTKSMLSALNLAYEEQEQRSFLRFQAIGLLMTLAAILGAILGLALLVLLPAVISISSASAPTPASCCSPARSPSWCCSCCRRSRCSTASARRATGALALDHAGLAGGHAAVARRLGAVLLLRQPLALRRHLWPAGRGGRRDDVVLGVGLRRAARRRAERRARAADRRTPPPARSRWAGAAPSSPTTSPTTSLRARLRTERRRRWSAPGGSSAGCGSASAARPAAAAWSTAPRR